MVEWGLMSQESEDEEIWEKPVSDWSVQDVCSWLQYGPLQNAAGLVQAAYSHHISGRALLRLTDNLLQRMGIQQNLHQSILVEVLELKLQQEIQQLLLITDGGPCCVMPLTVPWCITLEVHFVPGGGLFSGV
ncbi:unnamed protein product [Ranitomeya imitator]|uniref:SAM domain-containing protein n=1 Tax=Ranitomeya imitator TaxID=111125 RepID=A0ABN9ME64_9NEOB|nr:unnamed protein product [Ranitomeya imitator]